MKQNKPKAIKVWAFLRKDNSINPFFMFEKRRIAYDSGIYLHGYYKKVIRVEVKPI